MPIGEKKKLTIFIVANYKGQTSKLVISTAVIKMAVFLGSVVLVALTAGFIDYIGLLVQTAENKRLKAENALLSKQFQVVESKLNVLDASLEKVKSFSAKLKLITNIDDQDRALKLSVGPQPKSGQSLEGEEVPLDERVPIDHATEVDKPMVEAPPMHEEKGDLAVEEKRDYSTLAIRIEKSVKDTQLREQSVLDLWQGLSERQSLLNSTPSIKPSRGWFTSKFGYRISPFTGRPAMHNGLDLAATPGTPVFASADGVVIFAGYDETYGKLVSVDHGYGVTTRFGHNSQIFVHVGQRVNRWDVIASVGNTGRSTGPHLHYEVRVNNIPVDPINYILEE